MEFYTRKVSILVMTVNDWWSALNEPTYANDVLFPQRESPRLQCYRSHGDFVRLGTASLAVLTLHSEPRSCIICTLVTTLLLGILISQISESHFRNYLHVLSSG